MLIKNRYIYLISYVRIYRANKLKTYLVIFYSLFFTAAYQTNWIVSKSVWIVTSSKCRVDVYEIFDWMNETYAWFTSINVNGKCNREIVFKRVHLENFKGNKIKLNELHCRSEERCNNNQTIVTPKFRLSQSIDQTVGSL